MTTVYARNDESVDQLLRRFRSQVQQSKILSTVRKRRFFVSKGEARRLDKQRAIRKIRRRERRRMQNS